MADEINTNNTIDNSFDNVNNSNVQPPPTGAPISYAKPFLDVSKIEVFDGQNFKHWHERILSILDTHGVADTLTEHKPNSSTGRKKLENWTSSNKVCRHTILSTLSKELFDVYCSYKEANKIWELLLLKYIVEDVVGVTDDKDICTQLNEYHTLLENLKAKKIFLQDEFVTGVLIEKLPNSWKDYKQQLKHNAKQMSLAELIKHIIIEDTSWKEIEEARAIALVSRVNLLQGQKKRYDNKNSRFDYNKPNNTYFPKVANPTLEKKSEECYACGKPGHCASQCRKRATTTRENSPKPKGNLVDGDDIIAAVVSVDSQC